MPRASSIKRLPDDARRFIERLLREDRLTIDQKLESFRREFPEVDAPSRSALGRYAQQFAELAGRMRDIREVGTAIVGELGEDPNDRAGQLLVETVTTAATHIALNATDPEAKAMSIKEIGMLARAARNVIDARRMSLAERQEVSRLAREELQREQESNLRAAAKAQGMDEDQVQFWRKQVLGIG